MEFKRENIKGGSAYEDVAGYSRVVKAGPFVYVSVGGTNDVSVTIPSSDYTASGDNMSGYVVTCQMTKTDAGESSSDSSKSDSSEAASDSDSEESSSSDTDE